MSNHAEMLAMSSELESLPSVAVYLRNTCAPEFLLQQIEAGQLPSVVEDVYARLEGLWDAYTAAWPSVLRCRGMLAEIALAHGQFLWPGHSGVTSAHEAALAIAGDMLQAACTGCDIPWRKSGEIPFERRHIAGSAHESLAAIALVPIDGWDRIAPRIRQEVAAIRKLTPPPPASSVGRRTRENPERDAEIFEAVEVRGESRQSVADRLGLSDVSAVAHALKRYRKRRENN
jgi:hypothetical protein